MQIEPTALEKLTQKISQLDYVRDFRVAENRLHLETTLWNDYEQMKALQKDAILYQQIGKIQAFQETSHRAQMIENHLKQNPLIEDYYIKMQDVNDLLQYITNSIETKVNNILN